MEVLGLSQRVQVEAGRPRRAPTSRAFGNFDAGLLRRAALPPHASPGSCCASCAGASEVLFLDTHVSPTDNIVLAGALAAALYPRAGARRSVQRPPGLLVLAYRRGARGDARRRPASRSSSDAWLAGLAERPARAPAVRGDGHRSRPRAHRRAAPQSTPIVRAAGRHRRPVARRPRAELERFFERTGPVADAQIEIGEPHLRWSLSLRRGRARRAVPRVERQPAAGARAGLARRRLLGPARAARRASTSSSASRRAPRASSGRACLLRPLRRERKAELHVADLEEDDLSSYGRFDGVFCAGILYHLTRPWEHGRAHGGDHRPRLRRHARQRDRSHRAWPAIADACTANSGMTTR